MPTWPMYLRERLVYGAACESIVSKKMMLQQAPAKATSFIELGGKARQLKAFSFTSPEISTKCEESFTRYSFNLSKWLFK